MKLFKNESGIIYDIQRFSLHDGPGIRTVVFLKGCPMKCLWCSNPESQKKEAEYMGTELVGSCVTVENVMNTVLRDKVFYKGSGGGLTLSGGEALFQPEFSSALVMEAKKHGIHVTIETTGFAEWDTMWKVVKGIDLILLDFKAMDSLLHSQLTGVSNELILENAKRLIKNNKSVIARIPVIPKLNDTMENLIQTCKICENIGIEQIELLPYHRLGEGKYKKLGKPYALEGLMPMSRNEIKKIAQAVRLETTLDIRVV